VTKNAHIVQVWPLFDGIDTAQRNNFANVRTGISFAARVPCPDREQSWAEKRTEI
jgi:hypothetical protein